MNWLIRILSKFTNPINSDPSIWLERPYSLLGESWIDFRCGSCRGIYRCQEGEFQILAVQNTKKNDNFDRVLEWFKNSAKRDSCKISFLEVGNPKLKAKLEAQGFIGNKTKLTLDTNTF